MRHVERHILRCAQFVGVFLVLLQLFVTETASVGACCINLITVLCQFHHCIGRVQTS